MGITGTERVTRETLENIVDYKLRLRREEYSASDECINVWIKAGLDISNENSPTGLVMNSEDYQTLITSISQMPDSILIQLADKLGAPHTNYMIKGDCDYDY